MGFFLGEGGKSFASMERLGHLRYEILAGFGINIHEIRRKTYQASEFKKGRYYFLP
jgi:hypothetical protein